MPIEITVLTQNALITKLLKKMDHVKHANHSLEELIMPLHKDSSDKLNVSNVLATLNLENTAYQTEHVPPVETSLSQALMEEVARDQYAQKKAQWSKRMDHAVFAHTTTTTMLLTKNVKKESAPVDKDYRETVNVKHAQSTNTFQTMVKTACNATVALEKSAKLMDLARDAQHMNWSDFQESMPVRNAIDQNVPMVSFKKMDHAHHVTNAKPSIHQRLHVSSHLATQDQSSNMVESASNAQNSQLQSY